MGNEQDAPPAVFGLAGQRPDEPPHGRAVVLVRVRQRGACGVNDHKGRGQRPDAAPQRPPAGSFGGRAGPVGVRRHQGFRVRHQVQAVRGRVGDGSGSRRDQPGAPGHGCRIVFVSDQDGGAAPHVQPHGVAGSVAGFGGRHGKGQGGERLPHAASAAQRRHVARPEHGSAAAPRVHPQHGPGQVPRHGRKGPDSRRAHGVGFVQPLPEAVEGRGSVRPGRLRIGDGFRFGGRARLEGLEVAPGLHVFPGVDRGIDRLEGLG